MNDLLKKILYFKKEGSLLIILLYCILSFYLCYLFWYVVERLQLINHLNISSPLFSFIVSLPIGTLMLIYKIIDSMFYNKRIKDILTMPINRKHLFKIYLSEINVPFIELETLLFITLGLYTPDLLSVVKYYLSSITLIFLFSLSLCCLLLIILKICHTTHSGYIMIFFQYGGFLTTLLLFKNLLTYLLFFQRTASVTLFLSIVQAPLFLPAVFIGSIVLAIITFILFDHIFFLVLYGLVNNYLCSFIGVIFDCLMPDYTKNKTELLHGNSNKFLSLIVMTLKTIFEIYIINQLDCKKYLLPIVSFIDIILLILILILIYTKKSRRNTRD